MTKFLSVQSIESTWSKWSLWVLHELLIILLLGLLIGFDFWVMNRTSNCQAQNVTPKKFANLAVEEPMNWKLWKSIEEITSITFDACGWMYESACQLFPFLSHNFRAYVTS